MRRRMAKVHKLASSLDFVAVQETPSTPERAASVQTEFHFYVFFWSHCTLQRGGLALGVSVELLSHFSHISFMLFLSLLCSSAFQSGLAQEGVKTVRVLSSCSYSMLCDHLFLKLASCPLSWHIPAMRHSRHVCSVPQWTCLPCGAADISVV